MKEAHNMRDYHFATVLQILVCILLWEGHASAQQRQSLTITASPNPVGSGARAIGMGGAFIAVADDATAASWNPAGLTQLKRPEMSFVLSYFSRCEDFSSPLHPEAAKTQHTLSRDLNYFSIAYPFELLERNMIVSLNYQHLYQFDRNVNADFITSEPPILMEQKLKFRQRGQLSALSPAFAIEITPEIALGFTLNIWTDHLFWDNEWESHQAIKGTAWQSGKLVSTLESKIYQRYYDFSGLNMNLGFLWNVNSYVTIGGVLKTPFTGHLRHEKTVQNVTWNSEGQITTASDLLREKSSLEMPLSYGLGISVRLSDRFTVALDAYRTQWSHFIMENGKGERRSPVTGKLTSQTNVNATQQVRLGGEYLFIFTKTVIPLRCGLFYDPEPSENNPDDYWGFSLGTGISLGPIVLDFAYQFRRGNNVAGELLDIPKTTADVTQHLFLGSVIYHF